MQCYYSPAILQYLYKMKTVINLNNYISISNSFIYIHFDAISSLKRRMLKKFNNVINWISLQRKYLYNSNF